MAVIDWSFEVDKVGYKVVKWVFTTNGDVGKPFVPAGSYADITIHIFGTWGTGGKIEIEGSNEAAAAPTNWQDLHNFDGTVTLNNITADAIHQVLESPHQIRPIISAGTGTISINVLVKMKGSV